eukprot:gb/GECG01002870.1/.p1 GENE.gb/GECG01002870.1/~~gb/GECG01002870.1/.p1  ORF type:complete len:768 (+),score=117.31 gb/GECG01002870.1/:1-2304(+)
MESSEKTPESGARRVNSGVGDKRSGRELRRKKKSRTGTTDNNGKEYDTYSGADSESFPPDSQFSRSNSNFGDATPDSSDTPGGTLSSQFEELKVLGQGSFGMAVLVMSKKSRKRFVLKKINVQAMSEENVREALREVQVLRGLNHPNIVGYHGSFIDQGYLSIVLDYCDGGDLEQQVKLANKRGRNFSERQIIDWFIQILSGLHYVHRHRILHRDLKAGNVFLTSTGKVKLGDFGIAKILNDSGTMKSMAKTVIGTPYYMSPELCESRPYSYKSDVWSAGCILYELLTLRRAFESENIAALIYKIMSGSYKPIESNRYSQELINIVHSCLKNDPSSRPSVGELISVPVLRQRVSNLRNSQTSTSRRFGSSQQRTKKPVLKSFRRNRTPKVKDSSASSTAKNYGASNETTGENTPGEPTPEHEQQNGKYQRRRAPPPKLDFGSFSPEPANHQVNVSYYESPRKNTGGDQVDDWGEDPIFRERVVSPDDRDAILKGLESNTTDKSGFNDTDEQQDVESGGGGLRLHSTKRVPQRRNRVTRTHSEGEQFTPAGKDVHSSTHSDIERQGNDYGTARSRRSYNNSSFRNFSLASDSSSSSSEKQDESLTASLYGAAGEATSRISGAIDKNLQEIDLLSERVNECEIEEEYSQFESKHAENTMASLDEFQNEYDTPSPAANQNQKNSYYSRFTSEEDASAHIEKRRQQCIDEMGFERFQELYEDLKHSQEPQGEGSVDRGRSHTVEEISDFGKVAYLLQLERQCEGKGIGEVE